MNKNIKKYQLITNACSVNVMNLTKLYSDLKNN